jgi:glycosyltransferase involved in cell wall biosynthesis
MEKLIASHQALFVSHANYLKNSPGGVQICTQEYINTLNAAGFSLTRLSYKTETRIISRLRRKLHPRPYADLLPVKLADNIISQVENSNIDWIFLNQVDTAPVAKRLKERLGTKCKIVLLSHGLESTDIFHGIRTRNDDSNFSRITLADLRILSQSLVEEYKHRQYIDYIFCLSAFETELEHWLGATNVTWLPRTIPANALSWHPNSSRLGFVGTIDHSPNREGLILFLEALQKIAPEHVRLRLVGGPESAAKAIVKRFPIVDYLGKLSNEELTQEASTWSCFVHPLFCYSRGCSTKLAIALGWQIPIITTPSGCRGYSWDKGNLPLAETPDSLAELALKMLDVELANATKEEIIAIVNSAPKLTDVASKVKSILAS